jgi:hypothetical protein
LSISRAQQEAVARYCKAHYDTLTLRVSKGFGEVLRQRATEAGYKHLNPYLAAAVQAFEEKQEQVTALDVEPVLPAPAFAEPDPNSITLYFTPEELQRFRLRASEWRETLEGWAQRVLVLQLTPPEEQQTNARPEKRKGFWG